MVGVDEGLHEVAADHQRGGVLDLLLLGQALELHGGVRGTARVQRGLWRAFLRRLSATRAQNYLASHY